MTRTGDLILAAIAESKAERPGADAGQARGHGPREPESPSPDNGPSSDAQILLRDGLPALVGGFAAVAASGIGLLPAVAAGLVSGAVYALARKINQP